MAILAALSHIGEDRIYVAFSAGYGLVQAPQRIASLVVIEFRDRADWSPRRRRMTVLARHVQIAVRAAGSAGRLRPR